MNTRVLVATVAGGAAFFLLGFLVYGLALDAWMKTQTVTYPGLLLEPPNFVTLILANLIWAFLIALIFDKWATISTFVGGLIGGATINLLMGLYNDLMFVSFMNLHTSFLPVVVNVIAFTLIGALAGGVIGAVLGMMNKDSRSAA